MAGISISAPDASWTDRFRFLKLRVEQVLPRDAAIHHIGFTVVRGLPAKDLIDIQVSVEALDTLDPSNLKKIGFHQVVAVSDHCQPGMDLAPAELDKLFFRSTSLAVHIHVARRAATTSGMP